MSRRKPLALAQAPEPVKRKPLEPRIGYDGQTQTLGHWDTEYHPDLAMWENRVARINEIRTGDSSVVGALEKVWWTVARASWDVDSQSDAKDDDPAVQLVRANLLRKGAPELSAYRMRTKWSQFLWENFLADVFGVSIFEVVERMQEGPLGTLRVVDHAAWIHPASVWQIRVDRDGALLGIVQRFQARWWDAKKGGADRYGSEQTDYFEDFIPAENLYVRTRRQEGSNVEGNSMLRGMYADAKRNQSLRNWQAIHAQRVAVGIPKVKLTPEAPPEIQSRAVDMAKSMRGGAQDRLFVVETPGVEVGWVNNETGAFDLTSLLRSGEDRLRGVASLEWAGLGLSGAGGARAVGDVQQRPFWLMCEGIAADIAEDIQAQIIEMRLTRPNFGAAAPPPSLRVADVSPPDVDAIAKASDAGLVIITAEDENDIRRSLKMRPLRPDEMAAHEAALKVKRAPPKPPEPKRAAPVEKPQPPEDDDAEELSERIELAAKRPQVAPSEHESAHVTLDVLRGAYDDLATDAAQALRSIREQAVDELLKGARIKGMTVTLGKASKAQAAMKAALLAVADKAREAGRESARAEITSQVAALAKPEETLAHRVARAIGLADAPAPFDPFSRYEKRRLVKGVSSVLSVFNEETEATVMLDIEAIMGAIVRGLKREIVGGLAQEMNDADAIAAARRAILDRSDTPLEQAGRSVASRGINAGRAEVAEQAMESLPDADLKIETATRTSVLEPSTCDECHALHGTTVDVDSDDYFALMPPARCDGGDYCRCFYTYSVRPA